MIRHPLYAPGNNANDVALLVLNETVAGVALAQVANATTVSHRVQVAKGSHWAPICCS